jgi:hypothetical protein
MYLMMEVNGNQLEELGFKAEKKGFFSQWKTLKNKLRQEHHLTLNEAAEKAFRK